MSDKRNNSADGTAPEPRRPRKSRIDSATDPAAPTLSTAATPLPTMAEARANLRKTSIAQRFAVRQRAIDQEPNSQRRGMLQLFHDMDMQTLPPLVARLGLPGDEAKLRNEAIGRLTKFLRERALQHAAHAGCPEHNPPPPSVAKLPAQVVADVKVASAILHPLFVKHVVPKADLALVCQAFDAFARGELLVGPDPTDGAPDSANLVSFTTFGEIARLHADKAHTTLWGRLLHVFAATAGQYVEAYRPPAPAFSLYVVARRRATSPLSNEQWADWSRLSHQAVMARYAQILSRAFRVNQPCRGQHLSDANARLRKPPSANKGSIPAATDRPPLA
jgi:hypothetical protein